MEILEVKDGAIEGIKIIKFKRFLDERGYFTEPFRNSQFKELDFLKDVTFQQANESFSKRGVVRGLHFQWNPHMGKLLRTLKGRMIDMFVDIRMGSPTLGKLGMYEIDSRTQNDFGEWIWVPPGFAHGNFFTEPTVIEYYCSGEWSPKCEAGILSLDNNWVDTSICDQNLLTELQLLQHSGQAIVSDKDKHAYQLEDWLKTKESVQFQYEDLR